MRDKDTGVELILISLYDLYIYTKGQTKIG